MTPALTLQKDLDFLSARVHGRRSRLAEGSNLDELCRIRTVPELARRLYPGSNILFALDLQRHMVRELVRELSELAAGLEGNDAASMSWQCVRFQVENLKVLARGFANGAALDLLRPHLVELPDGLELDAASLANAPSFEAFASAAPPGHLRESLESAREAYRAQPRPFILETALDRGYLGELLRRAGRLGGGEREDVLRLAGQEAGIFNLMLAVRGVFHYRLKPELLAGLRVPGSAISAGRFAAMLSAGDVKSAAAPAVGTVLDAAPAAADAALVETMAWNRFLRLANKTFRNSHMGAGAAIGYAAIRRVELANLITLSEGMRVGLDPRVLRSRLIPRSPAEATDV